MIPTVATVYSACVSLCRYNMGMGLHRKAVDDRLQQYGSGQSFLARQRQVHSKRAGTPLAPTNR